jgi:chromosomal replication initiator protein
MKNKKVCIDEDVLKKAITLIKEYELYANKTRKAEIKELLMYMKKNKLKKRLLDFQPILRESSRLYNVPIELITTRSRKREIVEARQYSMWKIKKSSKLSLREIGKLCGEFDHATVLYACREIENRMETNQLLFQN